jgi:xylan 1,4-beta-xylosidase
MVNIRNSSFMSAALLLFLAFSASAQEMRLDLATKLAPLEIDRMALGQGGLSEQPMWDDRLNEVRMLHPRIIRLFIQEYFDLMPAPGKYHWESLDASVDLIRRTGATPLMNIDFKPRVLYPAIDEKIVDPASYEQWEQLIFEMVRHYKQRGSGIQYWEVSNEPDIGENGGCPYLFTPENYPRYYQHTVSAIRRADPAARVGGPALANSRSPILPALLDFADRSKVPLDFVSWHIYSSDPQQVRATIDYVHGLLRAHPSLHPETILNEWNMALRDPPQDPQFQPAYILETIYQMKAAGLDYSCYYHIRDYQIDFDSFARFMSPRGVASMARWWNRSTQWDGLFDYGGRTRPSYYAFKLLSRLTGVRLALESPNGTVNGFATYDERLLIHNVLLWNFSKEAAQALITVDHVPGEMDLRKVTLDASAPSDDDNARLRPSPAQIVHAGTQQLRFDLPPYGIVYFSLESRR